MHKYLYVHADPIQGIDPTGKWTASGVLAGVSVGGTLGSIGMPFLGAAYLSATGKLSMQGVFEQLKRPEIWAAATAGVLGGTAISATAQKAFLLKVGKEAAKKFTPAVGAVMSVVGFVQSARLTYGLITEELPGEDPEEYVATLIAGGLITSLAGKAIKGMAAKGVENDARYWTLSSRDQALYNKGQSILPSGLHSRLPSDPLRRGTALERLFSRSQMADVKTQGFYEMARNTIKRDGFTVFDWLKTGLTPELRFIFSENSLATFSSVVGAIHISADILVD